MTSPVLYRIECIAADRNGHPQRINRSREGHEQIERSDKPFENTALKAMRNAGYAVFTHYDHTNLDKDPNPLVFYALMLDGKEEEREPRKVLDKVFGTATSSSILIEHLIHHAEGVFS
mgnify:CR=1 FL=1|tara:strand:- start:908 stop:1261 length:354 start_codon:yes stop_codon:yes gene_type:complete